MIFAAGRRPRSASIRTSESATITASVPAAR